MIVEYSLIETLDLVDVDSFYDASASTIEMHFPYWPAENMTAEEKKIFYITLFRDTCQQSPTGLPPIPNSRWIMFKATADGVDSLLSAGAIMSDNCYIPQWYFTKPDANGSRNWLYTQDEAEHAFYRANGITSFMVSAFKGTMLYTNIKQRALAGRYNILSEDILDLNGQDWVRFIIEVRSTPL